MSVSKPFVFALICQELGAGAVREKLGVNATGLAFNSLAAIEQGAGGRTNPMVNAGAIATTSLVPGASVAAKWSFIHDGLSRFAGRKLTLNEEVYASAIQTNFRNQAIARLLQSYGRIYCDPAEATDALHQTMFAQCERPRPRGDGGDACRRRRQPAHQGARGGCGRLPLRARRHDHGGPCTKPPAIGSTRSACRAKAASAAGSSRFRRAKADWGHSPRRSIARETASRASWSQNSCPSGWAWTFSFQNPRFNSRA